MFFLRQIRVNTLLWFLTCFFLLVSEGRSNDSYGLNSRTSLFYRQNPIGLQAFYSIEYPFEYGYNTKYEMTSKSITPSVLWGVNPAYGQMGAQIEWMPSLPVITRIAWQNYRFLGANGALLEFDSVNNNYSDEERKRRKDDCQAEWANQLTMGLVLRIKAKKIIFRNETTYSYWHMPKEEKYYLDWDTDLLVKGNDRILLNRTALLYELPYDLIGGPIYEFTKALKSREQHQRISVLLMFHKNLPVLSEVDLFALPGFHLQDKNRENQFLLIMGLEKHFKF